MATFTINGYEMRSNTAHVVEDIQQSELQIVSPLGMSTLACTYAQKNPGNAEVSLADYNILLDGVHLNDGQLPDRIELFDLTWGIQGGNYVSRVLNLVFRESDSWRDIVFAVDQTPLPSLVNATQANAFLGASRFSLVDTRNTNDTFEIQLDKMPNVDIRGVLLKLFDGDSEENDSFSFFQEFDAISTEASETGFIINESSTHADDLPTVPFSELPLDEELAEPPTKPGIDEFDF